MAGRSRGSFAERRAERAAIDDPELVVAAALRFLETRSRSVSEVRRRLMHAGYRADLVEAAIGRLGDLGVLDDQAFARAWVESRDRARPRGEAALRQELAVRGVERDVVDAALVERPDTDEVAARRLLERRAASLARVADPRARRQKAYALLARNGFDPSVCGAVSREWAGGEGDEE